MTMAAVDYPDTFRKGPNPGRHPLINELSEIMAERGIPGRSLCDRAGIARGSITRWRRRGHTPNIAVFAAVLQVLGYDLVIRKQRQKGEPE